MDTIATNLVVLAVLKATLGGILEDNGKPIPTYFPEYVAAIQDAGTFHNRQRKTTISGAVTRQKVQRNGDLVSNRLYLPDATSIPNECFKDYSSLTEVVAPNVTSIGNSAFENCRNLKHVEFSPNLSTIGDRAFHCCNRLVNTNVYEHVTSVGSMAFSYCESLGVLPLAYFGQVGGEAFAHSKISYMLHEEVSVDALGTHRLFYKSVLPDNILFEYERGYNFGEEFCKDATLKTNRRFIFFAQGTNTRKSAFYNSFIAGIEDYEGDPSTTFGESSFRACRFLTHVNAPHTVTSIGNFCFSGCPQLHTVNLASATKIGAGAFCKCLALTNLVLTACTDFGTDQTGYGDQVYRSLSYRGGPFSANSGYTHANFVKASGDYAGPTYKIPLTSLTLPAVQKIGVNSFGDATDYQFTNIMDLYLPNLTTAQIKAMDTYPYWFLHPSCTIHASDGNFTYGN